MMMMMKQWRGCAGVEMKGGGGTLFKCKVPLWSGEWKAVAEGKGLGEREWERERKRGMSVR
jgi:hypothetical protein